MSDIGKIFKAAIEGHEMPFDAGAWDKLNKQLDNPMEDAFRNALEGHEAPYNPKAWKAIKGRVNSTPSILHWVSGTAAALGLIAIGIFVSTPNDDMDVIVNATPSYKHAPISSIENNTEKQKTQSENILEENSLAETEEIRSTSETTEKNIARANNADFIAPIPNSSLAPIDTSTDFAGPEMTPSFTESPKYGEEIKTRKNTNEDFSEHNLKNNELLALFSIETSTICTGEVLHVSPESTENNLIYEWLFGDGNRKIALNAQHSYVHAGSYTISLNVYDHGHSTLLATHTEAIHIKESPAADFTIHQPTEHLPAFQFECLTEEKEHVTWKINNQLFADKDLFEYTFKQKGNYNVQLKTTNSNNCSSIIEKSIEVKEDFNLYAPTAFSTESATNNYFMPSALEVMNKEFEMVIFNKAGNQIYQTKNVNEPWRGIDSRMNDMAPSGEMYTWIVYLKNSNGTTDRYFGQVLKL